MTQPTEGPWRVYDRFCSTYGRRFLGIGGPGEESDICKVHTEKDISTRSADECLANAHLLAASREMFEALMSCNNEDYYLDGDDEVQGQSFNNALVVAALNKAKGIKP